ncbi:MULTISPECIES: helix-turn-helix domain-containing protein [unclassified Cryobacterium]|uniref:winged helix-turn-helix transcriptional regulator n=1 Tax=unclassified Cryobacterium TaxID=2649013 RepID=UPI001447A93C|nr:MULTISPECIES: helix-turn-helix domain-containing protein [unclassified Cryobacterium]
MAARNYGQYCGVVTAVELVGERWALLIVRDLLVGARRYSDLKNGLPRIPTNILSTRLKELQQAGVVRRVPLAHGLVYELTEFGRGLEDVILALGRWGFQAMGEPDQGDIVTPDSMTIAFRTAFSPDAASALPSTVYDAHIADFALRLHVESADLRVLRLGTAPRGTAHLAFASGPALRKLISGEVSPADAIEQEVVHVLSGDPALLGRFAETFHLAARPAA